MSHLFVPILIVKSVQRAAASGEKAQQFRMMRSSVSKIEARFLTSFKTHKSGYRVLCVQ